MMGFQIFLAVMLLLGIGAEANPMERCVEEMRFDDEAESLINLASEEQLNLFCEKTTSFLNCMNDVMRQETGMNLNELANLLRGTEIGKALSLLVNVQELVHDICTEGTELRDDYLANAQCYKDMPNNTASVCEQRAKDSFSTFRELQAERGIRWNQFDEPCVVAAYQLGCLAAEVKDQCGEEGLETYKKIVKKVGLFKSGLCSSEILNTIQTDFLDRLEMTDDHKSLYRVIVNLKRRRR